MTEISYSGYRFPPEIIQQAIWRLQSEGISSLEPIQELVE